MATTCRHLLSILGVLFTFAVDAKPLVRQEVYIGPGASILSAVGVLDESLQLLLSASESILSTADAGCVKDRILNTSRLISTQRDIDWHHNFAPAVQEAWKFQHDHVGHGIAVLVTGQVRTGIYPEVVADMRKRVFDVLKRHSSDEAVEVFALLAFTSGGYHSWQQVGHLKQNTDISKSDVEKMLQGYGVKFTLEEFTGSNHFPDFNAEGCCNEVHPEQDCGGNHELSEQWLKVHGAIEMMKKTEESRDQRFTHVVRLRPDISVWKEIQLESPVEHSYPVVCVSGGGGSDALLTMPRWAVDAVDGMWRMTRDCPMPGVDECRTKDLVSWCSKNLIIGDELCGHLLWLGLLRQGVPVSGCSQGLALVRPKSLYHLTSS